MPKLPDGPQAVTAVGQTTRDVVTALECFSALLAPKLHTFSLTQTATILSTKAAAGSLVPLEDSARLNSSPKQADNFFTGTNSVPKPQTGWAERREVWSLDPGGRLHVVVTLREATSGERPAEIVYRRE